MTKRWAGPELPGLSAAATRAEPVRRLPPKLRRRPVRTELVREEDRLRPRRPVLVPDIHLEIADLPDETLNPDRDDAMRHADEMIEIDAPPPFLSEDGDAAPDLLAGLPRRFP